MRDNSASSGRKARKTLTDTGKGMAGPEGIEPSTFGCLSAVKSFSLASGRPLLYLSRANRTPD